VFEGSRAINSVEYCWKSKKNTNRFDRLDAYGDIMKSYFCGNDIYHFSKDTIRN
jgi:hypothetical protein